MCWFFLASLPARARRSGRSLEGLNAEVRATMLPDSLSTHLYPGGSVNSPSPVAPFPPGVVLRVAPVLRCTVSLIHLLLGPKSPRKFPNPPLVIFRERYGMRLFWDHWRRLGKWGWMGVRGETYRGGTGIARERRKRRVADGGKSNLRLLLVTRSSLFYFLALEKWEIHVRPALYLHLQIFLFSLQHIRRINSKFQKKRRSLLSMQGIRHTVFGCAVSSTAHTYTHKGGEQGCGGGGAGGGECVVCALRVGEETVWSTYKHFSLPSPAQFVLWGYRREAKTKGETSECVCACICGVNGACACVRKSERAVSEITCHL